MLDDVQRRGGGWWATAIGVVTLLFGATAMVTELQNALDRIWRSEAEDRQEGGLWAFVRRRLLSLSLILGLVFLLACLPSCFPWLAFGAVLQRVLRSERAFRIFNGVMGALLAASVLLFLR